MNAKERIAATLAHQPTDRTAIDCWLYQKQFVENLAAEYGPREQFLDEFNIDIFVGFVPWPNQMGRRLTIEELPEAVFDDPRDPKWLNYTGWNYDFGGVNVAQALEQHGHKRWIIAHAPALEPLLRRRGGGDLHVAAAPVPGHHAHALRHGQCGAALSAAVHHRHP